ncbi:DNA-processing protein DprA [Patescibacteria group bacterium]|nr:DNA-processing protein DprA [Patescibacteria group bacterium]MBU1448668.1 DNA-processing protein DprA [Patescibacteria group bacterium]MBU2612920.1 DNA-processing protein DprA [Patescibacteria group bacterium]
MEWNDNRIGWLGLAWFEGFGSRSIRRLRSKYPHDGMAAYSLAQDAYVTVGITESVAGRFVGWRAIADPEVFARRCEAEGIRFILPDDDEFPSYLAHASDPPASLFLRGAPLHLVRPIAVVGTRSMTPYGATATDRIVRDLTTAGCEIVSGLALGIDARAHAACLDMGGTTVAILAGGCDDGSIYPRSNTGLASRILAERGTIITELPPGTESFRHLFPLRNRIIAALSVATVVIEAAESSGSLITAALALEENRDVFAVPGPITSEQSSGTHKLLKMGAIPCTDADDILKLFDLRSPVPDAVRIVLTEEERVVLDAISRPLHVDDVVRDAQRPASTVTSTLISLELKGLVAEQDGNVFSRTKAGCRVAREKESDADG